MYFISGMSNQQEVGFALLDVCIQTGLDGGIASKQDRWLDQLHPLCRRELISLSLILESDSA